MSQPIPLDYRPSPKQLVFHQSRAPYRCYGGAAGGGKAELVTQPILTMRGWTVFGDLRAGDTVFGPNGVPTAVLAAHPIEARECYEVVFDDGQSVVCSGEHLWHTFTEREMHQCRSRTEGWRAQRRAKRLSRASGSRSPAFTAAITQRNKAHRPPLLAPPPGGVRDTRTLLATLTRRGRTNHFVRTTAPIELPLRTLPLDPYLLGVWLGDGTTSNGSITSADPEVMSEIARRGFPNHLTTRYLYRVDGLTALLREKGFLNRKHVPDEFFLASREQRLDLLRGLMDTDGHCNSRGQVEFDNTNRLLAEAVYSLATSLGWRPGFRVGTARLYGKDCGPRYRVKWRPDDYVFLLPRKRRRQVIDAPRLQFRAVRDIRPAGTRLVRCITVDREDGMYLTGRGLIPTHNSWAVRWEAYAQCLATPGWPAIILRRTEKELLQHIEKAKIEIPADLGYFREDDKMLRFHNGASLRFGHLQRPDELKKYLGDGFGMIGADELTLTLTFQEFIFFTHRNRSTLGTPNFVGATNPGGPGHAYVNALWVEKRAGGFQGWPYEGYDPKDFAYIPATVYDNLALMENDPGYERRLRNLPLAERKRLLEGSWKEQAGVYFDIFDSRMHVDVDPTFTIEPWIERAIGIDWGFGHPSAALWGAPDRNGSRYTVYRELAQNRLTPPQLAEAIVSMTPPAERRMVRYIFLSHDSDEERVENLSIRDQMDEVFMKYRMPATQAPLRSRIAGWMRIYEMLRSGQLVFRGQTEHDVGCVGLIESLPGLVRNPEKPNDVLKMDGDDIPDALRYLVASRWAMPDPPFEIRLQEELEALNQRFGEPADMQHAFFRHRIARANLAEKTSRIGLQVYRRPARRSSWRFGR